MTTTSKRPAVKHVSVVIPLPLFRQFQALARSEERTVSAEIRRLITQRVTDKAEAA